MSTILVVDDSALVNNLLCETLTTHGFDVMSAHDANNAYQLVQKRIPDLILLDIVLPDVNGVELCKAFRSYASTRHVPIILITGTASSTTEKVKGFQAGADDYILKPFETDELLERLRAVLRRTEQRASSPLMPASRVTPEIRPTAPAETAPAAPEISLGDTLSRALFSPSQLPEELPAVTLFFGILMTVLLGASAAAARGSGLRPLIVCMQAAALWGFLVAVLVVCASIAGISLRWKAGARLLSAAALPLLLKMAGGAVFSGWTTLSPFLFSASPALFRKTAIPGLNRLDFFELWSVMLLGILLSKRTGATRAKTIGVTLCVWVLGIFAALALLRTGGMP